MPKSKKLFSKVVIAGIGLMGGSLGLAIKQRRLAGQVMGWARRPQTLRQAKALGCIDVGTLSAAHAGKDADLVVFCGPVSTTPQLLATLLPAIPAGCLITDVGSTKGRLLQHVRWLLDSEKTDAGRELFQFVSSHPMAGSEKSGVLASQPDLYQGSLCALIQTDWTPKRGLARLKQFWRSVGCSRILVLTPQQHDRWAAVVSHLPHVVAVGLVQYLEEQAAQTPGLLDLAATGFRDTTRIAAGSPKMWQDILSGNQDEVMAALDAFARVLNRLRLDIKRGGKALLKELEKAQAFRQSMENIRHGR